MLKHTQTIRLQQQVGVGTWRVKNPGKHKNGEGEAYSEVYL